MHEGDKLNGELEVKGWHLKLGYVAHTFDTMGDNRLSSLIAFYNLMKMVLSAVIL